MSSDLKTRKFDLAYKAVKCEHLAMAHPDQASIFLAHRDKAISELEMIDKSLGEEGDFRGGDPEDLQAKKEEKRQESEDMMSVGKAQAGEESGEFRGGDPEDLQEKREEKRSEAAESGEAEEAEEADEEEMDPEEIAEEEELEAEKEAEKSFGQGASEVSPVDDASDYHARTVNGDPPSLLPPVKNIDPTAEDRPGKNQSRTWSDVTGAKLPFQGATWVDVRRYIMRGEDKKAMERKATFYRALNHGLTFDPTFYFDLEKAQKGDMVPGHKYVYRWMGQDGVWQYDYSGGMHDNHGPANFGNMQGHSLDVPEGHVDTHDPKKQDPKGAFKAGLDHVMEHGGTWNAQMPHPQTGEKSDMVMRIKGHKGGEKPQKPIEYMHAKHVRADQKMGDDDPFDFEKHKVKGKFAAKKFGGGKLRDLSTLEGQHRRREVHTENDGEDKPFLEWRMAGEAKSTGKIRGKDSDEGREVSVRFLNKEHPLYQGSTKGESKDGWQHSAYKDIGQLREALTEMKQRHGQMLGLVDSKKFPPIEGKPQSNMITQGKLKKKPEFVDRMDSGSWSGNEKDVIRWRPPSGEASTGRVQKQRKIFSPDWEDDAHERRVMHDLTHAPYEDENGNAAVDDHGKKKMGELFPLMVHNANKVIIERNNRLQSRPGFTGKGLISPGDERRDLINNTLLSAAGEGIKQALTTYNPAHDKAVEFHSHASDQMKHAMRQALSRELQSRMMGGVERQGGGSTGQTNYDEGQSRQIDKLDKKMSEAHEAQKGSVEDQYESPDAWIERAKGHLRNGMFENPHDGEDSPDDWEAYHAPYDAADQDLEKLAAKSKMLEDDGPKIEAIQNLIDKWNHEKGTPGGPGFLPPLEEKGNSDLVQRLDEISQGKGGGLDALLEDKFGKERLDSPIEQLQMLMDGHDQVGQEGHEGTEHHQNGMHHPDLLNYIKEHKAKTPRDLAHAASKNVMLGENGRESKSAREQYAGFQSWLQGSPKVDKVFGPTPNRAQYTQAPGEGEAAPGVQKRKRAEKAIKALQKAQEGFPGANAEAAQLDQTEGGAPEQGPTAESHPNYFDGKGQKLFQPTPEGVTPEDNPDYDPDPAGGSNWASKYQDPESGGTKYSYLHEDRTSNPKLHQNNTMRYLDTQLPKIRQFYKEKLASGQPMDRAVGLFLALMDQAKAKHHDEAEGGLTTLKVDDVNPGEGDTTEIKLGDGYTIRMTMDQTTRAVLDELTQGKEPDDLVFQIGDQAIDPATIEKFLSTMGVSADSFRTYHGTKQYSKEFQRVLDEGNHEDIEDAKSEAMEATGNKMGHDDGETSIQDHVDPVASEALHIMGAPQVHKSLATNTFTGETLTMRGWARRYATALRKAAYKLQDRVEFQGLKISIENKKGSSRKWHDPHNNQSGATKMHCAYGYVRGVKRKGADGDLVDVYVGPNESATTAFVVHQMKAPEFKKYDEDKVMLGFDSAKEAKAAYLKQYDKPGFFGSMTAMPVEKFKEKLNSGSSQMIKASAVHHVSAEHPDRSKEEELFGQWLHNYPIHEHEARWKKRQEKDEHHRSQLKKMPHRSIGVLVGTRTPVGDQPSMS